LREISAELAAAGHLNRYGKPYAAASVAGMVVQPGKRLKG
jgi:hypothetical protein